LFWEDQDNFDAGEFFQSVVKQYYVDAPFIPVEIHVPEIGTLVNPVALATTLL